MALQEISDLLQSSFFKQGETSNCSHDKGLNFNIDFSMYFRFDIKCPQRLSVSG